MLKESGYASFNLPIDIYLKAGPRDDQKKFSLMYDLDITKTTVQKYPFLVVNPSNEFRTKLLEGGGIMLISDGKFDALVLNIFVAFNDDTFFSNEFGTQTYISGHSDERTYSQPDSTTAKIRPQSSSSSSGTISKKHKNKSDEIKPTSTFENLFGSPILNSKNSPDPKLSNSSSSSSKVPISSSGNKIPSQKSSKDRPAEKSGKEKRDKKDKSGNTPKESSKESASKKSTTDDSTKHERREEKRKEKSSTKDRERSKEKSSKRPPSPKPTSRSPKRSASPLRASSSNSNRHENAKYDEKSSSSTGKKSKKEKRDKSKERDRSSAGDKSSKESKHQMQQAKHKEEKSSTKSMEKINGSSKKEESESKDRDKSNKFRSFDAKPPSPLDVPIKNPASTESKKSHDKDERKHKHKKKDKNKDKDRKKSKSKEISDESPLSTSSNRKRSNAPTPTQQQPPQTNRIPNAKSNAIPATTIPPPSLNRLSDKSSSEFDDDDYTDRTSPKPDKVSSSNDTNQSMDHLIEPIPEIIVTPRSNQTDSPKKHTDKSSAASSGKKSKEPKSNQSSASKEEKKRKRKSKSEKQKTDDTGGSGKRKSQQQSPPECDDPPAKIYKRDDEKIPKIKDDNILENKLLPGRTPPVPPHMTASPSTQKRFHQSPDSSKHVNLKRAADNALSSQPKKVHLSPSTSSTSESSSDSHHPNAKPVESPSNEKQYIAQLRALQQKIMTLQNNDELQQVVEMIAETGRYEVTNRTFDFDLCALDRTTVQRLQDRLG